MIINKKMFLEYCRATDNTKSFSIEDFKKCTNLEINEFIYIGDHFKELKEKFKGLIPNEK